MNLTRGESMEKEKDLKGQIMIEHDINQGVIHVSKDIGPLSEL